MAKEQKTVEQLEQELVDLKASMFDLITEAAHHQDEANRFKQGLQSLAILVVSVYEPEFEGRRPENLEELVSVLDRELAARAQ